MTYKPYPELREFLEGRIMHEAHRLNHLRKHGVTEGEQYWFQKGKLDAMNEIYEYMIPDDQKFEVHT